MFLVKHRTRCTPWNPAKEYDILVKSSEAGWNVYYACTFSSTKNSNCLTLGTSMNKTGEHFGRAFVMNLKNGTRTAAVLCYFLAKSDKRAD